MLIPIAAVMLWLGLLPSLLPNHRHADRGIFVSVAERILAGDKLYIGAFDNKEPFFYYIVAIERLFGRCGEFISEITLLLLASVSVYILLYRYHNRTTAFIIGAFATPIILTGAFYWPGYTHLPGTVLYLAALAMAMNGYYRWSGVTIGVLTLTKIIMGPIALFSVLVFIWAPPSVFSSVKRVVFGMLLSLVIGILIIDARGELTGFLDTCYDNVKYSQGYLIDGSSVIKKIYSHLNRVLNTHAFIVLVGTLGCLLTAWLRADQKSKPLALVATTSFCCSLITLALTGLWHHHNQILYAPAVLSLAALAVTDIPVSALSALAGAMLFAWILGGARPPLSYLEAVINFTDNWAALDKISPETMAMLSSAKASRYARLGGGHDGAHAIGLGSWKIVCPRFHQYPFDTNDTFEHVLSCVSTADTVLVASSFRPQQESSRWNSFVRRAEEILQSQFVCKYYGTIRVCNRSAGLWSH